jgi:1,4-alpha-glucan branching enzyme
MEKGFLSIVLHAHLPFVRHPEYPNFFEENWFFEAVTECYIPLLNLLDRLHDDGQNYRLTLSLSPTLMTMLRDELLLSRYLNHLLKLLELVDKEIDRTRKFPEYQKLALFYRHFFSNTLDSFQNRYDGNLLNAFKKHQQAGNLELITSAATHGFLPLLSTNKSAVLNQINVGLATFESNFGSTPSGFWLPECGYYPGLESLLGDAGIKYFFTDTHGVMNASVSPEFGIHAPLDCGNGVLAFARDPEVSRQVWSAQDGYPGDFDYREYYSDIGFDLDLDYIAAYILDGETRTHTGIKYHRITGGDLAKQIYHPQQALEKAQIHARDFIEKCQLQIDQLSKTMDRSPIIVAPYDAELLGHWWFEGPYWLEQVLRLANQPSNTIQAVSCEDYLTRYSLNQLATPSASTWGDQGYSRYWINETNDWIYPHLQQAITKMEILASAFANAPQQSILERALNQAARSLLLAQASDWPFIMKSGTTIEYARKRITDQLARFNYLHDTILVDDINEHYVTGLEQMDNIFPDIDFRNYSSQISGHLVIDEHLEIELS